MTPDHYGYITIIIASLLKTFQFDPCLVSEKFSFFPVFMSDFGCNGRRSVAGLEHFVHEDYNRGIF